MKPAPLEPRHRPENSHKTSQKCPRSVLFVDLGPSCDGTGGLRDPTFPLSASRFSFSFSFSHLESRPEMIRSNPFAVVLISLLFVLSLFSAWCACWWFLGVRELQQLKSQGQWMNQTSSTVQSLANEAIEYSRRNPDIEPLLRQFEVVPGRGGAAVAPTPVPTPDSTPGAPAKGTSPKATP